MSVIFIVTPIVVAGWPVFCGAAAAGAASLGFKVLRNRAAAAAEAGETDGSVEIEVENSEVLTEKVRPDDELILAKGDITARIYKDARGQCSIHVSGAGRSDEELRREGTALIHKIKQQYAYQKVTQELKNKGFSIAQEEAREDGRIRITFRKF